MLEDNKQIAKIFRALCDETRVEIIKLLKNQEMCACHISDNLKLSQSKLSYHMKILCESNIIECWNEGKWTHYKINKEGSENAILILKKITELNIVSKEFTCSKETIK